MKKIIAVFLIMSISGLYAQDYRVIKVDGSILYKKNDNPLEKGNSFADGEEFLFKTNNSRAAVIKPGKGRFILKPDNSDLAFAKANLAPAMSHMSSRSGALINRVDLENYFSGKYVILDEVKLKINKDVFLMDGNKYFYISYTYKGERIDKLLSYNADTLIINKTELLKVDGELILGSDVSDMALKYMNGTENNGRVTISTFTPIFPDKAMLKEEIQIVLEGYDKADNKEKLREAKSYINDFYGKANDDNVEEWIKKEFQL